ncbi:hypothetical protein BDV23DRAFT_151223 [Aspergillus alliaceus]|uniref:Uncharacterized protein n=1 Tax=Petromyces alliaceus TaxID=209559 RepID=A0A5N7CE55_PETAA|nr:hypothetical protein BDV23DRAFT_151223 [Aspergillus alliaceus]
MFPVIDIHPSSPSLKKTQRKANFLSRNFVLQSRSVRRPKATRRRGIKTGRRSWQALLAFFDVMKRKEKLRKGMRRGALFVAVVGHVPGADILPPGNRLPVLRHALRSQATRPTH